MKIAIDFDGVICKSDGIPTNKTSLEEREPVEYALDAINYFLSLKHTIWIFTSNNDLEGVKKWLKKYNFPDIEVTNIKNTAHVYIDDRAIRFTNWLDMRRYFG